VRPPTHQQYCRTLTAMTFHLEEERHTTKDSLTIGSMAFIPWLQLAERGKMAARCDFGFDWRCFIVTVR